MVNDHGYTVRKPMKTIAISEFKATCLALLENVRTSGEPILVTKRGKPIAEVSPPSRGAGKRRRLGAMAGTGRVAGDLVAPALDPTAWEALADD